MNSHKPDSSPVERPSTAQVEAQLARLVASGSFSGALRSQEFLRFVVSEALAGRQHRIGAYTIGVEVYDRPDDFDPRPTRSCGWRPAGFAGGSSATI